LTVQLWASYYGHDGTESGLGLAVHKEHIFVVGRTNSTAFPVSSNVTQYKGTNEDGFVFKLADSSNTGGSTAVRMEEHLNSNVRIFPNPTNSMASLNYELNKKSDVNIEVFNTLGQVSSKIEIKNQQSGKHSYQLSDTHLFNGVNFIKLTIGNNTKVVKLVVTQ